MAIDTDPDLDPWLQGGYEPVVDELVVHDLDVTGTIPEGLRGAYLRNGPNPAFPPIGRYHVFDGDGMVHGVELADGHATYRNRWVDSRGLGMERRLGRSLFGGLGEFRMPEPEVLEEVGMMKNLANTNIVRHAGHLLALWEAGCPTELDDELGTIGEFDFGGRLQGAMTAHPKVDPSTGELLFFGAGPVAPFLRFHVADAAGELVRSEDIQLPRAVMMHDFVCTDRYAVFFDLPAVFDLDGMMRGEAGIVWHPEHGARVGVLSREQSGPDVRWLDIEPCYAFHFLNGWEDGNTIVVDGCRADEMPTTFGDETLEKLVPPSLHRWRIDLDAGVVHTEQLDDRPSDFPRIDDRLTGRRNRYGYVGHLVPGEAGTGEFDGIVKHDLGRSTSTIHHYGEGVAAGEPVFAPDPSGSDEDDGWLLNLVYDKAEDSSALVILDARDMTAEPVARVRMPRRVPHGFHGNWFAA